jgi:DNA-directed RNA polymerase specialized sigma24 family protein
MDTAPGPVTGAAKRLNARLWDPWPEHLHHLHDPEKEDEVSRLFEIFLRLLLKARKPKGYEDLPLQERNDLVRDLLFYFYENHFRRLKQYRNIGKPHAVWVLKVAANYIQDRLRQLDAEASHIHRDSYEDLSARNLVDENPLWEDRSKRESLARIVREELSGLEEECWLLLSRTAEGFRLKDLRRLIGRSTTATWNAREKCFAELHRRLVARDSAFGVPL